MIKKVKILSSWIYLGNEVKDTIIEADTEFLDKHKIVYDSNVERETKKISGIEYKTSKLGEVKKG